MKYRKLRIAWSVTWGVVAALLCVLWVRSYWRVDAISGHTAEINALGVVSVQGRLVATADDSVSFDWEWQSSEIDEELIARDLFDDYLAIRRENTMMIVAAPYWLLVLLVCVISYAPWLPFRFSLRTLLIATTLVAVGLGLVVWLSQ